MSENFLETPSSPVVVNEETKNLLLNTASWAKIMAIISFVLYGFIIAIGLGWGLAGFIAPQDAAIGPMQGYIIAIMYAGMGILGIIPTIYMYRFATGLPAAFESNDVAAVNAALNYHKRYYKFAVILTMVIIAICVVAGVILAISKAVN